MSTSPARRPVIGVTLDSEPAGGYSKLPWYALRENYCDVVAAAGGLPIALPHEPELAQHYLALIDGLVVTGGAFDVDPALYGGGERHGTVKLKERRTRFEWAMTQGAVERDMPVLGICGGQQLLNVVLGGTLIQHIPDAVPDALAHEQPNPRTEPGHEVSVAAGHAAASDHRRRPPAGQQRPPPGGRAGRCRASWSAPPPPDGVIEAIEDPRRRFCLGVQWHPEYGISPGDTALIEAFVRAAACR